MIWSRCTNRKAPSPLYSGERGVTGPHETPAMPHTAVPPLIGLDLNSSCLRAVSGSAGASQMLPLDGTHAELALAISLAGRTPEVGRAGYALCRHSPHLACLNFLGQLGSTQEWHAGRHRLDASRA